MKLSPRFFLQTILLAVRQIRAHKLRSFLTTLDIMIGVASVSTVIAALTGLKEQVLSEFESFGASKMFIFPDQPDRAGQNRYPWREIKLKERELDGLVELPVLRTVHTKHRLPSHRHPRSKRGPQHQCGWHLAKLA